MARQVIAGADLAARRAARASYERPWLQSQASSSSSIRNRPALQTSSSSCIRNRPALQTSGSTAATAGEAQGTPTTVVTAPEPTMQLQPSSSRPLQTVTTAVRRSLLPAPRRRSSTPHASGPQTQASALPTPPTEEPQPRSALRKEGTRSTKRVSWDGRTEWATYTKGMKTKFYGRERLPALMEEGDDE